MKPDTWKTARRRQGAARGRVRFEPGQLAQALEEMSEAVVRPSAGVAYTADEPPTDAVSRDDAVTRLVDRIRHQLDPGGVLAG